MMFRLATTGIALTALISTALAADLPVRSAPPSVAVFSWTGCYLGGHVGGAWARSNFGGPFVSSFPNGPTPPGTIALSEPNLRIDNSGFLGGGQIGCNYQFMPNWVIGIDADASWSDNKGSRNQTGTASATTGFVAGIFTTTASSSGTFSWKADFIGTVTGRLGYTSDRTMIYAKGGAAWIRDKYRFNGQVVSNTCVQAGSTSSCNPISSTTTAFDFNASETRFGWTVGGGIEWAFWGNWSVKLEYNHLDFGDREVTFNNPVQGNIPVNVTQRLDEVKLGVNYIFGAR